MRKKIIAQLKAKFQNELRLNKSHLGLLRSIIESLLVLHTVNLVELSTKICGKSKMNSAYRRLQRFFSKVELCEIAVAKIVIKILNLEALPKLTLIIDRTYWMYGKVHLNFLYLAISFKGYGIPLFFKILTDKKGHSHVEDRKDLLAKFIILLGKERIDYIVGDREFDGFEWLNYLEANAISFVQRLKENSIYMTNAHGEMVKAASLCHDLKPLEKRCLGIRRIYKSKKFPVHITIAKNQKGKVMLLAHSQMDDACHSYAYRWGIELGFRALKSGGFNMEDTHLTIPERITTLLQILNMVLAYAFVLGTILDINDPIKFKTHGRRAISFVRYALLTIKSATLNGLYIPANLDYPPATRLVFSKLSCTLTTC
jgi:hypothetical protein